jgi:SNF2 family DNA or RNA helicase
MDDARIDVQLLDNETVVRLQRGTAVPEEVWLQLRSEWGSSGRDVATQLLVPLERFLARRSALGKLARRASVSIFLDDRIRALVQHANSDQAALHTALDGLQALDPAELEARLAGGRFTRDLRTFQERDLARLLALSHGANFSVPGAGKTAVAFAVYEANRLAGHLDRLLVIGPLSAFPSWIEEASTCFSEPPVLHRFDSGPIPKDAEVVLVNYHKLASNYDALAEWVSQRPTMVILDEAHRMKKGWGGQWGRACLNLAYLARRRDILTGTPAPQSAKDFVALLDYLWPTQALRLLPGDALISQPPPDAGQRVAQAISPLFVRTTKEELALPPVTHKAIVVPLEGLHRGIYLALRDQYAGQFALGRATRADFLRMGRIVMYLLEAATNPKLLTAGSLEGADPDVFRHPPLVIPDGSELADLIGRYNEYETPLKFRELGRLIKENADLGRKTLVWSNFVRNLKLLERQLAVYQPAVIHGGVPAYDPEGGVSRESEIGRFRADESCRVLLANPAAMGEGISLHHECHDAIYLERTFNAGQYLQSIDRIHRLGLPPGVETRISFLLTDETIDLAVDSRVRDKAERLGEMLDDKNLATVALPDDEDYGPPIDDAMDVEALFRHLRGDDGG